jgi:hypothetical protein
MPVWDVICWERPVTCALPPRRLTQRISHVLWGLHAYSHLANEEDLVILRLLPTRLTPGSRAKSMDCESPSTLITVWDIGEVEKNFPEGRSGKTSGRSG